MGQPQAAAQSPHQADEVSAEPGHNLRTQGPDACPKPCNNTNTQIMFSFEYLLLCA